MTKAIFATAADLIVIVDRDLAVAQNSPGTEFLWLRRRRRHGASVFALMHPDDRAVVELASSGC